MERKINKGDMVLAEIQPNILVTGVVDDIDDFNVVYLLGDDGEPYCAPVTMCDKVPY